MGDHSGLDEHRGFGEHRGLDDHSGFGEHGGLDDQQTIPALVGGLRRGEASAWHALVLRFTPLVRRIARNYRLNDADTEDVAQTVWLRLVEHVERLRDPRALPGWIATTARHESTGLAARRARTSPVGQLVDTIDELRPSAPEIDAGLLREEVVATLQAGLAELPPGQRTLLLLLVAEPPVSYREIGAMLGMPVGSIGPTRARSLARLSATPAVHDYVDVACGEGRTTARDGELQHTA